ncbi:MAG TPA: hypothetical protein VGG09_10120 [Acidimicrobiales bacterium]
MVDCRTAGIEQTIELIDMLIAATAIDLGLPVTQNAGWRTCSVTG